MGEFTSIGKEFDKKIKEDMVLICKEIRKRIPRVLSIILTGGFSRGEGPVKKEGKKFYPYNDYDIQVICDNKMREEKINSISTKISKTLGYEGIINFYPLKKEEQKIKNNFYIDMKCDIPKDLNNLLPRIRTYELKNYSKILYGKDLRYLIPNYDLKEIPLSEGAKLLLDRMSQMIEYYSIENKHENEFLTYIIQQAYTACCTSLLLLSKKYQIGYKKSMEILKKTYKKDFPELYEKVPMLHKKIEEFVNWKINPKILPNKNVKEEWFIAKQSILEVSKYFFSKFLKKRIKHIEDLSQEIQNMDKKFYLPYLNKIIKNKVGINLDKFSKILLPGISLLFKYKYYQRLKKLKNIKYKKIFLHKSPDLVIFSSLIYLISSINENKMDNNLLKIGRNILEKVYPCKGKNWEEVSIDYTNAYIAFFLQKL